MQPSPKQSPTSTPLTAAQTPVAEKPAEAGGATPPSVSDDAAIQAEIEKVIAADATLSRLDVSTTVESGRVTMVGSVKSPDLKQRVEKAVRSVKGVISVDNQLVVTEATP
jgi:osmotically-inducible protein OsmY